jgi:hypothetical protein
MKEHSIFWPLVLIATGVIWLLVGMDVIPAANLWALTHLLPFVLISAGLGLILRSFWRYAGMLTSLIVVGGAVLAIVFAPQLGWAGMSPLVWNIGADGFGGGVPGSGRIDSETRKISNVEAISVGYPAKVVIRQGNTESVTLKGDDNVLPQILTLNEGGVLKIRMGEENWKKRVDPSQTVEITITVKDLKRVVFSSAGTLLVEDLKTDSLELVLSGAGDMNLSQLAVDSLDVTISGAGNVKADGTAQDLGIRISGMGNFKGEDLQGQTAEVRVTGTGNATVWVEEELEAVISGAGSVNYRGNPTIQEHISGAGSIKSLDATR